MAGTIWVGTRKGVFSLRADASRRSWRLAGVNDHPLLPVWVTGPGFPIGQLPHPVSVDPRDPHHLNPGVSSSGVFETHDGGRDWAPSNGGCSAESLPDPDPQYGHDMHCLAMHPRQRDRLAASPLRSCTNGCAEVTADGVTEREGDTLHLICALNGG